MYFHYLENPSCVYCHTYLAVVRIVDQNGQRSCQKARRVFGLWIKRQHEPLFSEAEKINQNINLFNL